MNFTVPMPKFDDKLVEIIIELEAYRNRPLIGTTEPWLFLELKNIFHIVEAIASARIEGNHTTIVDFVSNQSKLQNQPKNQSSNSSESISEIINILKTLSFIDNNIQYPIDKQFILEMQRHIVRDLHDEGDSQGGGSFRNIPISISGSKHQPPQPADINNYILSLTKMINTMNDRRTDLLKVALVHHRFVWIHPFRNRNGRTVRILTYAMLCKLGLITPGNLRLYNPASVLASNREKYYEMLENADDLSDEHLLDWCRYFLGGLLQEIKSSENLSNYNFILNEILLPSIKNAKFAGLLTQREYEALIITSQKSSTKAKDLEPVFKKKVTPNTITVFIKSLKQKNLVTPFKEGGREYHLSLSNNVLTPQIMNMLNKHGFLPKNI
ncbi:MAG: Fic family protein [Candidatus Ancillula sp.]|jgi:Fic family protein|nr:Fic family protein [Candidatus Ancillula sp.]